MKKDRLEMFSDGVFAIVITLLILEIKIPEHGDLVKAGGMYEYLKNIWPSYLAYAVTFLMIGIYWSNHHHLFMFIIKSTNHFFNMINILFLMTIAFMPFTTAIFGRFILDNQYHNGAVTAYCIGILLPQISLFILFFYGRSKKGIFDTDLLPSFLNRQLIKLCMATTLTVIALALSFNYSIVSIIIIGLAFLIYFLPPEKPKYSKTTLQTPIE